jgi:hypothetical protein
MDILIEKKKEIIKEEGFNYKTSKIVEVNEEIEKMEVKIRKTE